LRVDHDVLILRLHSDQYTIEIPFLRFLSHSLESTRGFCLYPSASLISLSHRLFTTSNLETLTCTENYRFIRSVHLGLRESNHSMQITA